MELEPDMKRISKIIALFFGLLLIINPTIKAQQKISITGHGSINYIPIKEFSNYLNSLSSYVEYSVDEISFGGSLNFNYYFHQNQSIYLAVEYISSNVSMAGGFAVIKWIFKTIPVSIGYEYSTDIQPKSLRFFMSTGMIYSYFENNEKISSDTGSSSKIYKDNSWGFEFSSGIEKSIVEDIFIVAELKYRYLGNYRMNMYNEFDEVNLSGLGLLMGLMFSIN